MAKKKLLMLNDPLSTVVPSCSSAYSSPASEVLRSFITALPHLNSWAGWGPAAQGQGIARIDKSKHPFASCTGIGQCGTSSVEPFL